MSGITQIPTASVGSSYLIGASLENDSIIFTFSDGSTANVIFKDLIANLITSAEGVLASSLSQVLEASSIVNPSLGTEKNGDVKAVGDEGFFYINGEWVQVYP